MAHEHNHESLSCKHECLHYCPCCDKVYCCKCGRERPGYSYTYTYPVYPFPSPAYPPYTWTAGTAVPFTGEDFIPCECKHAE